MPVETRSFRDTSAVGRFPSVTLAAGDEDPEEAPEEAPAKAPEEAKDDVCRQWLRRVGRCCCPETDDDVTNTLVTALEEGKDEGELGKRPAPGDSELAELPLKVKSIDLMKGKAGAERLAHRTHLYQCDDFIIRRGQTFHMWLTLSRAFQPDTDKLHLELKTGSLPTVSKGTHVIIPLVDELRDNRWQVAPDEWDGARMKLSVNSPASAAVGRYRLQVETECPSGRAISAHDPANDIYVLFNPWCDEDAVFMDAEDERQEYVVNDVGRIYYGTQDQIAVRTWDYGQFDDGILAACLFVLEKSGTPPSGWGDPVNVVRVVSGMINSRDDQGVVEGNWSGNYIQGTSPTVWSGSMEILTEYHKNNGTPVKYGQCWVFAGIVTTVLRCLGIPSRTVTNFSSAHDTDVSLTTDVYLDEDLQPLAHLNADSVWNFHVWNDCWMARHDLPAGMGGWQALDATPQETSQGTFRCGPASLAAIRDGQVFLKHDAQFVFAEVNSDKIYWQRNPDGTFSRIYSEKKVVGHLMSTKAVGSDERSDITHLYKHPEGTAAERIAVEMACRYGSKAEAYSSPVVEDVAIAVAMDGDGPQMGRDAELTVTLRNSSAEHRRVVLHSQIAVMYYTGVHKATVRTEHTDLDLLPTEVKVLEWTLEYKDYKDQLVDQAALMLTLSGRVKETQQVLATQFSFRLRTPGLLLKPIGKAVVGEKILVEISFTNPLPQVLTSVMFHVEGLGLTTARKIHYGDIRSRATVSFTEHMVPTLAGPRKLLASLHCRQLTQVHGVTDVAVRQRSYGAL
ncbi:protein-glutamine gamma-glutamyltransferase K-like [Phycodurus eques]|uniref:protein-glutamine gamma-glutamyltransferase K-like n=1 Tax=Phycodurus eques TaxID=693459 RepID=UPI002ACE7BFA|nr:protein-glutamine gamma-glutamyltransferase K-like [Phycodurus eques]XP_061539757.1 protein-glutamine gamma-glutamyltransferase K-like [Phycodurus eques]XP_061539758.1 protein-glutamine gamma-glutamyltransferase K-like [Phycodurus eques]